MGLSACKGKAAERNSDISSYKILQKWDLPAVLNEVSGIAWIDEDRIACIQDEDGIIFIYDLASSKIVDKINFGNGGDYEGITLIEKDAYVLRSDGVIFEVPDFLKGGQKAKKHVTRINQLPGINLEGLSADPKNNRLLLAVKKRKNFQRYKEIFSFNLDKKTLDKAPFFKVDLSDPVFKDVDEKLEDRFSPGEISFHPGTGEIYILDGTQPKILITDEDGSPKELLMLSLDDFGNPEGLTFDPEGVVYISNEAENDPANILKLSLDRKTR